MDQVRFDTSCGIATTPISTNKPLAIGSCSISGSMGVRSIPGIWVRRRLNPSYVIYLAIQQNVATSTRRQALNSIVFLYKKVLDIRVDKKLERARVKRHPRPSVVMAQREVLKGKVGIEIRCHYVAL